MDKDDHKVTAKDVAREAGVSVATVSYVLNGRIDQKISPETKKKVFQIANLLNYVPSHAAKSLATGKSNALGISYVLSDSATKNASLSHFVNMLIERLNQLHYDVVFVPAKRPDDSFLQIGNIDAIIAIELDDKDFRTLAGSYLVPVICADMIVHDPLFYQVYEDIPFLIEKAVMELPSAEKYYLIYDSFGNTNYENYILSLPNNIFPLRKRDISKSIIEKMNNENVIFLGAFLALEFMARKDFSSLISKENICVILSEDEQTLIPESCHTIINNECKKANLTIDITINALNRNFDVTHDNKLR